MSSSCDLAQSSKGDPVLWMQEHLATAIPTQATTGIFDATTKANPDSFQTTHGITPSGTAKSGDVAGPPGPAPGRGELERERARG